jgi:hypothetical protein
VVLDEQHGQLAVVADLLDEAPELRHLLVVEPGLQLVEQEQLRCGDERACQLDYASVLNGSPATGRCAIASRPT